LEGGVDAKDWISLAGIFSTATISLVTVLINNRRERRQQSRDDQLRREQQQREDQLREKERDHAPHIEFGIDCRVFDTTGEDRAVEFMICINNKGRIRQEIRNLSIRLRGISEGQDLKFWDGHGHRLEFPVKLVDETQIIPAEAVYYFVEPGIDQMFDYVTKIPRKIRYLLVHSRFDYGSDSFHTVERVFDMVQSRSTNRENEPQSTS